MAQQGSDPAGANFTNDLAEQVSTLTFDHLTSDVVAIAKQCILDTIGVTLAGANEPSAQILRATLTAERGPSSVHGLATVIGTRQKAPAFDAAMLNGTAAHALDFDDVSQAMGGHPSVPVFPAVLAVAEDLRVSGRSLITAFVAGFETEARIGLSLGPDHYQRGFHTTATVGTIGAAAAVASLIGLSPAATISAMGIAATQAAGIKAAFGTDCKPFQAGRAASSGVLAARLAMNGFSSAHDAIAGDQGFSRSHSDTFDSGYVCRKFGDPWHIHDCLFKFHAACYLTHATIEALRTLYPTVREQLHAVSTIDVRVPPGHLTVCAIPRPTTGLEGKFSLAFTAAMALSTGRCDSSQFTDWSVNRPDYSAIAARVRIIPDSALGPMASSVAVHMTDGTSFVASADTESRGWSTDPEEQQPQLVDKFRSLVDPILGGGQAENLIDLIRHLDELPDVLLLAKATQAGIAQVRQGRSARRST